jgi:hypothetical protein
VDGYRPSARVDPGAAAVADVVIKCLQVAQGVQLSRKTCLNV